MTKIFSDPSTSSAKPAKENPFVGAAAAREQLQKTEEARKRVDEELARCKDRSGHQPQDPAIEPEQSLKVAKHWLLGASMTRVLESSNSDNLSVRLGALAHVVHTVGILKRLRLLSYEEVDHVSNVLEQYKTAVLKCDSAQMRQT